MERSPLVFRMVKGAERRGRDAVVAPLIESQGLLTLLLASIHEKFKGAEAARRLFQKKRQ